MGNVPIIGPGGPLGAVGPDVRPEHAQILAYMAAASNVDDLSDLIKVIENVMRNITTRAEATGKAQGDVYLDPRNPFYQSIIGGIQDLKEAGLFLQLYFPPNSDEWKSIEELLQSMNYGHDGPPLDSLGNIPTIARKFMELSVKIPPGEFNPKDASELMDARKERFWLKIGDMFSGIKGSWDTVFAALPNQIKQMKADIDARKSWVEYLQTVDRELINALNRPVNNKPAAMYEYLLQESTRTDWSRFPPNVRETLANTLAVLKELIKNPPLPDNIPRNFFAGHIKQYQEEIPVKTKEMEFLAAFIVFNGDISKKIASAQNAVNTVIKERLLPLPTQINVLLTRINTTILQSVGTSPTVPTNNSFYPLLATQITHLKGIGNQLIASLPPNYNTRPILAILDRLIALEKLTTAVPPRPLPVSEVKMLTEWANAFMVAGGHIQGAPGFPADIPSGIRQSQFWRKFADMFTELDKQASGLEKTTVDRIERLKSAEELSAALQPILTDLQNKVIGPLSATPPKPVIAVLDDLSDIFRRLEKVGIDKDSPPEILRPLNAILYGTDEHGTKIGQGLIDLKGPIVNGKQTTFSDMLMGAIIMQQMDKWFTDNKFPMPPASPGPIDPPDYSAFFMDGGGNYIGRMNREGTGLFDSIRNHFEDKWPGFATDSTFRTPFIDRARVETMIMNYPSALGRPEQLQPIILPGVYIDRTPKDDTGVVIGNVWSFTQWRSHTAPDWTPGSEYQVSYIRPPPTSAVRWESVKVVGYVYAPVTTQLTNDRAILNGMIISNQDALQDIKKTITDFPKPEDYTKQRIEQETFLRELRNSTIIQDIRRAQTIAMQISQQARFNSSLPDMLRHVLLDEVMPTQGAVLEDYARRLYFFNISIGIFNDISGPTAAFTNAHTNYAIGSEFATIFTPGGTATPDQPHKYPPGDYFTGNIARATQMIRQQTDQASRDLRALQNQRKAISDAFSRVEKEWEQENITLDQKNELQDRLRELQRHFDQAIEDTSEIYDFLQLIKVERVSATEGGEKFILRYVPPDDPTRPIFNQNLLAELAKIEDRVINGVPPPPPARPGDNNVGGLAVIAQTLTTSKQHYSSMTDEAQLTLQNSLTEVQQMWTIIATVLQLLQQSYLTMARAIKGQ